MPNLYFSPKETGFYLQEMEMPSDAVEVSAHAEAFLRRAIIWGASGFVFAKGQITVTFPEALRVYVTDNDAPFNFQCNEVS